MRMDTTRMRVLSGHRYLSSEPVASASVPGHMSHDAMSSEISLVSCDTSCDG